ncbi:sodium:solute symporter [candidate division KSB1 bacterium]
MHYIDWIVIISYLCLLFGIIYKSRQHSQTMTDFAIDKQSTPGILVFATLSASFIGPGYTMGLTEQGFQTGLLYLFLYLGFSIQTLLIGQYIAPRLRQYKGAYTVGDIMGFHYGKIARIFTGLISLLYCAGIVGIVAQVSGRILEGAVQIPYTWGVIGSTIIVVIYSSTGGMRTVLFTDVFQFVMLSLAMSVLLFSIFIGIPNVDNVLNNIPEGFANPLHSTSFLVFSGLFLGFLLGETLVPPYTNRAFVSKDKTSAKQGFIYSGIFSIFWFAMVLTVGIVARALYPEIDAGGSFMHMVNVYMPIGLYGMMMVAIISIIMSTQDSYLNAASVSFVRDIIESFKVNVSDSKALYYSKVTTFVIGILGIVFALNAEGIIQALLLNYTFWAPTIVLPLIIGILLPDKVKPISGVVSIFTGALSVMLWEWVLEIPFGIPSLAFGILGNQLGFWITHYLSKNETKSALLKSSSGCSN